MASWSSRFLIPTAPADEKRTALPALRTAPMCRRRGLPEMVWITRTAERLDPDFLIGVTTSAPANTLDLDQQVGRPP